MNISQAAAASGISAKMIRHYEAIGLIPPAGRTAAGYRAYTAREVRILAFIRRARALGFPLPEIRALLALWSDRDRHSADVKRLAVQHIEQLEAKARMLTELASTLRTLADACSGDARPDCPIIESLVSGERPA